MFFDNTEWFLLGVFSILFLYFITHYFTRTGEKYNLYFALGCFISFIRIVIGRAYAVESLVAYYPIIKRIDYFSFMWGPTFYILLAGNLFPERWHKKITRAFVIVTSLLSIFIVVTKIEFFSHLYIYDFVIVFSMLYGTYIFAVALIKKDKFALPMFCANLLFIIGIVYDVLYKSGVISSPVGEIHPFSYFIYLYISSVVLAKKFAIIDKKSIESHVNFLHAQIQPHFLYNTINTIIAYSRTDPDQTRLLLVELSTYLRGKFKNQKDMYTSLKEEIELIKSYLNIEQVRFKGRLFVEYDIDDDCNILIPCLILQPIVENAVKHGLLPKKEGGKLSISVKKEDGNVVVRIKDNGKGMDIKRLPDILHGSKKEAGIGLSNTNERLKRFYNTQIEAESEMGKGTKVTVTIPINKRKK